MTTIIRPLGNDILVGPLPSIKVTHGGIHIPDQFQDDRKQFLVIARGSGPRIDPEIQPGRRCLLDPGIQGVRDIEDGTGRKVVHAARILAVW